MFMLSSLPFPVPFVICKGTVLPCQICGDTWLTHSKQTLSRQIATLLWGAWEWLVLRKIKQESFWSDASLQQMHPYWEDLLEECWISYSKNRIIRKEDNLLSLSIAVPLDLGAKPCKAPNHLSWMLKIFYTPLSFLLCNDTGGYGDSGAGHAYVGLESHVYASHWLKYFFFFCAVWLCSFWTSTCCGCCAEQRRLTALATDTGFIVSSSSGIPALHSFIWSRQSLLSLHYLPHLPKYL